MANVFFTGFPGFLGSELLPRILSRDPEVRAVCLVQPKFAALAHRRVCDLAAAHADLAGRIEILEGDLTEAGLGIGPAGGWKPEIGEIYHLAAIYDLGVPREPAMRVNVEGTRHILDFAAECGRLRRFHYVSTCYVSGTHPGRFTEDDLDMGQGFHNFYEESKFLAEVDVQDRMSQGFPATIYRPAIVVGDSRTGATQKYDGPYSVIRLLLRQPRRAVMPIIGDPATTEVNLVPRDFVMDAIVYLSALPESVGKVYHLADTAPLTVEELLGELARSTGRDLIRIPLPLGLAKFSLRHVPGMKQLVGIPADTVDYFVHPGHYGTERTQPVLEAGGIRCPSFPEYAERLVAFVRAHPEIASAGMA